ncbi:MAG: 50S ribosomal protein L30 [Thermodesulfobacterium geofontis]|uniref:50S ribosomal protein L30 n=1 Tax=Thermodesulfobacterium geofontis TaxID=1295609 RepID=A0A2N7QFF9_9BACT|nr:MAG: 50S ribosomal protein L30 [Thermodesulfobacterium geofontis]PMP97509.1 MAG: 50S ribosomal protein L30 [Thermodesulfobacterium geofontis]
MKRLKITLIRSKYGRSPNQRETLKGLGLRKIGQSVIREDNPMVRGMIRKVEHLVKVEELNE